MAERILGPGQGHEGEKILDGRRMWKEVGGRGGHSLERAVEAKARRQGG